MGSSNSTGYALTPNYVSRREKVGILTECTVWHILSSFIGLVVFCLSMWTIGFETAVDVEALSYLFIGYSCFLIIATTRIGYLKISGGPKDSNGAFIFQPSQFDRAFMSMGILTMLTMFSTIRLVYFYLTFKSYLHLSEEPVTVDPSFNFHLIIWGNIHAALDPFLIAFFVYPILVLWTLNDEYNPRLNETKST